MVSRRWMVLALLGVACSQRTPPVARANAPPARSDVDAGAGAHLSDPVAAAAPVALAAPAAHAPVPPSLAPYLADTVWTGKGPPPTAYSIFEVPEASPAPRYASLDRDRCEAALHDRQVDFARAEDTPGVRAPVRLNGPLHGVSIHS